MPTFSLKIKMTLVVFLLISVVTLAAAGLGLLFFIREFKASIAGQQSAALSMAAAELDAKIARAQRGLTAVALSTPPSLPGDPAAMQRFLDQRLDLSQLFHDGTGFFSATGQLLAFSPVNQALPFGNFSSSEFFRQTMRSGHPCISEPFQAAGGSGHPVVLFTAPVRDAKGRVAGLLGGRVDLMEENFLGRLAKLKLGERGNFFLFNKHRQMIVYRDLERLPKGLLAPGKSALVDLALAGYQGSGETTNPAAEEAVCSFKRLTTGWILAAQLPTSEAYAPIQRARRLVGYSVALLMPLALLTVWLFVGHLTAPLLLFAGRVREMGGTGTGYQPIPVSTRDEIGELAQAFNSMMQELGSQRSLLEKQKAFSEQLLQQTAVSCFVIDADHRVIIWNRACEELTGVGAEQVIGSREPWRGFYETPRRVLADIVVDNSLHEMADLYSCYADSPLMTDGLRAEGWYRLKGKQRFICFDAAPIRDAEGQVIAAIETLQDVTLRANTEEQLRSMVAAIGESEERFRRLVELSLDGIAILVERRFVFVNPAGCVMLGCRTQEELLGKQMREFLQRDSEEIFDEQLEYTEQSRSCAPWIEERLLRRDRTTVEVEIGASRFVYRGQEALQVIFRDITERKSAEAKLETLAHYDSLTSLPNRVLFFDRLHHVVSEAKRFHYAFALMFLDLDRFKQINDTLGHAAGDAVLVAAGQRLKQCVRACDMVARMGGDEFTIILSKMADRPDATYVAERIIEALCRPFVIEGATASVGVSIGICVSAADDTDLDGMVRHADLALYRAKEDGRNCYRFYAPEMLGSREWEKEAARAKPQGAETGAQEERQGPGAG
jgi:diguanylate cyclase (GGDEF)-like protein/PAS domain S-box-containing protein